MVSTRSLYYVFVAAAMAGCSSSPVALTPAGSPTATPVAATATPSAAPTGTAAPTNAPTATATPTIVPTAGPTASAAPTATPTAKPTSAAAIVSNVNPLSFLNNPTVTACSSSYTIGFSVSESGYDGSFTAISSNAALVTVAQADGHDFTATQETSSNVDPNTTATVTIEDSHGNSLALPVNFQKTCVP